MEIFSSIVSFLVALMCCIFMRGENIENETMYDERQALGRGKAFRNAFFTLIIYSVTLAVLHSFFNIFIFDNLLTSVLVGTLISLSVFSVTAIKEDSFNAVAENFILRGFFIFLIGFVNLFLGIGHIVMGNILVNGKITINCLNGLIAILLLTIFYWNWKRFCKVEKEFLEEYEEDNEMNLTAEEILELERMQIEECKIVTDDEIEEFEKLANDILEENCDKEE
jgi:hypothetical protein